MPDFTSGRMLEVIEAQLVMESVGSTPEDKAEACVILENISQPELNELRIILERIHVIQKILER